jgi:hypothetical protein
VKFQPPSFATIAGQSLKKNNSVPNKRLKMDESGYSPSHTPMAIMENAGKNQGNTTYIVVFDARFKNQKDAIVAGVPPLISY